MIVLRESTSAQNISFIPRVDNVTSIVLKNETTQVETTYTISSFTTSTYYLVLNEILTLTEDTFYNMVAYNGSAEVYRDRIYCTNQFNNSNLNIDFSIPLNSVEKTYSLNKDKFKYQTTTNEYITL